MILYMKKVPCHILLISLLFYQGGFCQDESNYSKSKGKNISEYNFYLLKGNYLLNHQKREDAINFFSKAIDINPQNSKGYINRGLVYEQIDEFKLAIEDYSRLLELNPSDNMGYIRRGVCWSKIKEHEKAIEDFTKAIRIDPSDDLAYSHRGLSWEELGN